MSIAYCCILIAALLPYVWVAFAKTAAPGYNNKNPRGWIARQDSYRVRNAHAAHLNAFEAFAPFAAAVLMAQLAGVSPALISKLAIAFIVARVLHGVLYLRAVALMRSLAWLAGMACVVALMALAMVSIGG
ncbi:MAPEG family protein [Denitratimonas sp. CY0512]|uniref:MAPEG family protein n=1 Tax=Denitratimonas sp. CY0512 TaxID=3131940 RepID=UPI0030A5FD16